jgi:hypothetical protein
VSTRVDIIRERIVRDKPRVGKILMAEVGGVSVRVQQLGKEAIQLRD